MKGSLFLDFMPFFPPHILSSIANESQKDNGAHSSAIFASVLSINGESDSFKWSLILNQWLSSSITAHLCLLWGLFCNWSSLRQSLISGIWLAGGRCRHWLCGCVWTGFHLVRADIPVRKSAERHRGASPPPDECFPGRINVPSRSEHHCALRDSLLFSVISSPWAAWMWCIKCLVLSRISAPTAPTTRYGPDPALIRSNFPLGTFQTLLFEVQDAT